MKFQNIFLILVVRLSPLQLESLGNLGSLGRIKEFREFREFRDESDESDETTNTNTLPKCSSLPRLLVRLSVCLLVCLRKKVSY